MTEDENKPPEEPRGYKTVLPRAPFDEELLRDTFCAVISLKAHADGNWRETFSEALANNRIDPAEIKPIAVQGSLALPLAKWRRRELEEGVDHAPEIIYHQQLSDVIAMARDCAAENRPTECRQLLEFARESLEGMRAEGAAIMNRMLLRSLVHMLLSQLFEQQSDFAQAEAHQLALVGLSEECDESTEFGQFARRSLDLHKRGRLDRLARLCEKQDKHEEARIWRERALSLPETVLDKMRNWTPEE